VLLEMGQPIKLVYFPHSCVVSLIVPLASGEMVETAMVGCESVVGGASVLTSNIALQKAVVQSCMEPLVSKIVANFWTMRGYSG
jgi:hypothetical protein